MDLVVERLFLAVLVQSTGANVKVSNLQKSTPNNEEYTKLRYVSGVMD
jgi:hypothetical protein